jgi:uncharacterized protein YyaL (SSP411 family)
MKVNPLSLVKPQNIARTLSACRASVIPRPREDVSLEKNLRATYSWLCTAQDATPDGGVAGWYSLLNGWSASYPETTGYIIPTFLAYSRALSSPEAKERALRMASWEIDVQLPDGAVRSGTMTADPAPAVFNTGQALFGWIAAYQAAGDENFARATQRAAGWLMGQQNDDGAWRKNLSARTTSTVQTYNVRTAWGLALAGRVLDEPQWTEAASRNCDWALTQQKDNGWFENNIFYKNEVPLLHTIAYTLEGLLGVGMLLEEERYVTAVETGVKQLASIYERTTKLKGRYDNDWHSRTYWRCLTGEAQMACVLLRMAKLSPPRRQFSETADTIIKDLARLQNIDGPYPETCGGIGGSQPLWGGYLPMCYINWGAKFYLDALLMTLHDTDPHAV